MVVLSVVWYIEYEIILGVLGKLECGMFWWVVKVFGFCLFGFVR